MYVPMYYIFFQKKGAIFFRSWVLSWLLMEYGRHKSYVLGVGKSSIYYFEIEWHMSIAVFMQSSNYIRRSLWTDIIILFNEHISVFIKSINFVTGKHIWWRKQRRYWTFRSGIRGPTHFVKLPQSGIPRINDHRGPGSFRRFVSSSWRQWPKSGFRDFNWMSEVSQAKIICILCRSMQSQRFWKRKEEFYSLFIFS